MPPKHGSGKQPPPNRLHAIAPREDQAPPSSSSDQSPSTASFPDVPRTRLPPRSRNGCWCDEGKPRCKQCARLGHQCDYSPKLAFKDETPKIVDKYVGSGAASPAWDPSTESASNDGFFRSRTQDSLPPFTTLSSDEDWQRKAEHRPPGTYYVVANSSSFSDVEEYKQTPDEAQSESTSANSWPDSKGRSENVSLDSETIILGTFEDNQRRPSIFPSTSGVSTESDGSNPTLTSPLSATLSRGFDQLRVSPEPSALAAGPSSHDEEDNLQSELQYQYRAVVRWHIFQNNSLMPDISAQIEDVLEREARHYPPLDHALKALSALSLSHQNGAQGINALQYYQQALEPLKQERGLASDGPFLTHFVLMLYEIAGTEPFWPYHMASLKRIIHLRRQNLDSEPFPYVIWWTCLVDLNALLSGSGDGALFLSLINHDAVPTAFEMQEAPSFLGSTAIFDGSQEILIAAWKLQREVSIAAARIGEAALQLRATDPSLSVANGVPMHRIQELRQHVARTIGILRHAWKMGWTQTLATAVKENRLPVEAYASFTAARLMYHACVILIHTNMWPTQRGDISSEDLGPVFDAATSIIELSQETLHARRLERRFFIFPLLLVGSVMTERSDQHRIRSMLGGFERVRLGSNTRATCALLDFYSERHAQLGESRAAIPIIDLMGSIQEMESKPVLYGL